MCELFSGQDPRRYASVRRSLRLRWADYSELSGQCAPLRCSLTLFWRLALARAARLSRIVSEVC